LIGGGHYQTETGIQGLQIDISWFPKSQYS
jgi:hypothetical protein